jgi:hypothetical protein
MAAHSLKFMAIVKFLRLYLGTLRLYHLPFAMPLDPRVAEAILATDVLFLIGPLQSIGASGHGGGIAADADFQIASTGT